MLEMLASCLRSSPEVNSGLKKKDEWDSYLGKNFKRNGFFCVKHLLQNVNIRNTFM